MPSLRILVGGQTFEAPLPERAVRVGTALTCELTLSCEGVSGEHCVLEPMSGGQWRLKDLSSGRATRLNGTEVRQVSLKPGDVIQVGAAEIVYDPEGAEAPPAPRAVVAARAVAAVAVPPPAPAATAAPARSSSPDPVPAPLATEAGPSERATVPVAPRRAPSGSRRLLLPIVLLTLAGAAAAGFGLWGSGGNDAAAVEKRAKDDLDAALARYRAHDYLAAQRGLADLVARVRSGDAARQAQTWLESANAAVAEGQKELDAWTAMALDFDLATAAGRRDVFLEEHGRSFAERVEATFTAIRGEQDRWRRAEAARVDGEASALVLEGKYREARARWQKGRASAPRGVDLGPEVEAGLARVDAAAEAGARDLLERVERAVTYRGAAAGSEMLGAALAHYEGTGAQARLSERLAALERLAKEQRPTGPAPTVPGPAPAPAPAPTGPPSPGPGSGPAAPGLLERARTEVDAAVAQRAFARAVERIDAALALGPDAAAKDELLLRRGDLALARNGLDLLAGDVTASPARYGRIELGANLFAAPTAADRDGVTVAVTGGTTRLLWSTMKAELFALLAERMKPAGPDLIPVGSLLHAVGAAAAAERTLVRAWEGGSDKQALFELLGRWRREAVPEGGYVPYEDRFVTPAERDRLVLDSRIRGAVDRYGTARDAAGRRAAEDELRSLGDPARPALEKALRDQRAAVGDALLARKVWTAGRTRQRLFELLQKRRAHALALIEDAAAYPYPNPGHQGQAEVERRVAEVREVWERPFALVAATDDDVRQDLDRITEVDEALARLLPSYRPDLTALEAAASKALDMPSYAPATAQAGREYDLKVLAFNERVATSATPEEKDNVRAVNEYRMMMGRAAVRIEERLVRAARGHSRHMREHGYFAHENGAFPEVKDPGTRARRQGYGGGVGENIAWGTPTGRDAFQAWFGSSGHHRNMLGRGWTEMGAGRAQPSHWTQNFGALGGRSLGDPAALPAPAADVAPESEDGPSTRPTGPLVPRVPDEPVPGPPPGTPDPGDGAPPDK